MAVYNGEKTMRESIDSILNQSFGDLTLFISDDTSTDSTPDICQEYAARDHRVKYYRQPKNLGMLPNLKFCLDRADLELFTWVDADDLRSPDFLKVCVEAIDRRGVDAAATVVADIDSYSRNIRELNELAELSGGPSVRQVTKYVLQPEVLGKCNLMYCVFKTKVAKKLWEIYPQKKEWGSDYHYSLALISRYRVYVDKGDYLKKRVGGISSLDAIKDDRPDKVNRLIIKDPKNHMFPYGRFGQYFRGHMKALEGTPYRPLVAILLLARLPRAFLIYLKERNYRKFFKRLLGLK